MSQRLASHIAIPTDSEDIVLKGEFLWQRDGVYDYGGIKIWLSSPPSQSKQGNKHSFFLQNDVKSRQLFREFIVNAAQSREVDFLYNDNEGVVEITLPKHLSGLFKKFLDELPFQNGSQVPYVRHPLLHYWRFAALNVYY